MIRVPLSLAISLAPLSMPSVVAAQSSTVVVQAPHTPPPAPSVAVPSAPASDSVTLPSDAASLPMRFSLLTALYPVGPAFGGGNGRSLPSGCGEPSVTAAGTIFPTRPYAQFQLTPRLVLHGFSDLGCPGDPYAPLDAGLGGGLTYSAPLSPSLWLVSSAGIYGIPAHDFIPARGTVSLGLDVAAKTKDDRVFTTGLGILTTGRGVRLIPRISGTF